MTLTEDRLIETGLPDNTSLTLSEIQEIMENQILAKSFRDIVDKTNKLQVGDPIKISSIVVENKQLKEEIKDTRLRYQAIDLNYDRRVEELDNLKEELSKTVGYVLTLKNQLENVKDWHKQSIDGYTFPNEYNNLLKLSGLLKDIKK